MWMALIFLAISAAWNSATPLDSPELLQVSSRTSLQVPPFGFYGLIQSDQEGNLFFHGDKGSVNDPTVLKLGSRNGSPTLFTVPPELAKNTFFVQFHVAPDGEVSTLLATADGIHYVQPYGADGKPKSEIKLETPEHLLVRDFAVFKTGELLLGGFFREAAPEGRRGKGFVGIFSRSGKMAREISVATKDIDLAEVFKHVHDGYAVGGEDGNIYLLQSTKIIVLSPSGEVVRRIGLNLPSGFTGRQLFISQGYAAVMLHRPRKNSINEVEALVLDLSTGEQFGLYRTPDELGNMIVGFSRKDGFTFLTSKANVLELITAAIP